MIDLHREIDALEGAAHALEQSLRPQLDAIKFMRDAARRLRLEVRSGSVEDDRTPAPTQGGPRP